MTHNYSPHYAAPAGKPYYNEFATPSPTPSPRYYHESPAVPPPRPHTRAHVRHASTGFNNAEFSSPRQPSLSSPRYNSSGHYATANVSDSRSQRRPSGSGSRPKYERRNSFSFYRTSDPHGDSDEDEFVEINGIIYMLPARSRSMRFRDMHHQHQRHHSHTARGYSTNSYSYAQAGPGGYPAAVFDRTPAYDNGQFTPMRRQSFSVPQRSHTARPQSSHQKKTAPPPQPAPAKKATLADAKKHRIPTGYSLKNWDPTEEPILLLGSVFDANSLGKWIYDWTCHVHGSGSPLSDMAGDLWLLLIRLSGNVREAEDILPKVRDVEKKEILDDFIESGDRLMDRLCKLLATCEKFMLKASKKRTGDGRALGVEFVDTLFGRDRELDETEKFMTSLTLWEHRFRTNCHEILQQPTK